MSDLKTYFAAPGRAETPSAAEAGDLAVRFPWFLPGRILRETLTGESDPRVALTAPWRAESSLRRAAVDASALTQLSSEEIIDRFLQEEDLRIVAGEGEPEEEVVLQPELDDDDEVVTEELAAEEPSVIITRRPCVLLKTVKKHPPYRVDPDQCKGCKLCMRIGCPAISWKEKKAVIDPTQCVGCGVCEQLCNFDAFRHEA